MKEYKIKRHYNENGLLLTDIITEFIQSFLDNDLNLLKENDKMNLDMALYL